MYNYSIDRIFIMISLICRQTNRHDKLLDLFVDNTYIYVHMYIKCSNLFQLYKIVSNQRFLQHFIRARICAYDKMIIVTAERTIINVIRDEITILYVNTLA